LLLHTVHMIPHPENAATMRGCSGAWLNTYFASASCRGQGLEAEFPYDFRDTNKCPVNPNRDSIKAQMNLKWAYVPKTSADLEAAVSYAPTQIGILATGAFQYTTGVVECSRDSNTGYSTNREHQI
jgi:hypothetical protein